MVNRSRMKTLFSNRLATRVEVRFVQVVQWQCTRACPYVCVHIVGRLSDRNRVVACVCVCLCLCSGFSTLAPTEHMWNACEWLSVCLRSYIAVS